MTFGFIAKPEAMVFHFPFQFFRLKINTSSTRVKSVTGHPCIQPLLIVFYIQQRSFYSIDREIFIKGRGDSFEILGDLL